MKRHSPSLALVVLTSVGFRAPTAEPQMEFQRRGEGIVFEPYASNILPVTPSIQHDDAVAACSSGFVWMAQRAA